MLGSDECRESLMKAGRAYCNRPQAITIEGGEGCVFKDNTFSDWDTVLDVEFDPNGMRLIRMEDYSTQNPKGTAYLWEILSDGNAVCLGEI